MDDVIDEKNLELYQDKKYTLNLNSGAVHVENKASLKQRLAWLFLAWKSIPILKSYSKDDLDEKMIKFSVNLSEIKKAIGYDSKNNEYLKEILEELVTTKVKWNLLNKDFQVWGASGLLAYFEVLSTKEKAVCTYAFSPFIQSKLAHPEMYVKLNLLVTKNISSKNTLAIYCIALDYLNVKVNYGEKVLTVDELRKILGFKEDDYKNTGDLYKWVIKNSQDEINNNTDMQLEIEVRREDETKKRSKIVAFKLKMSIKEEYLNFYKPQKQAEKIDFIEDKPFLNKIEKTLKLRKEIIIENPEVLKFLAKYSISITTDTMQEKLKEIQEMFGEEKSENYLLFLMKYAESEYKKGLVKNFSGFFVSLIKDDTQIGNYLYELEKEAKQEEAKKIRIESLVESKIKENYESSIANDYENYLLENIEKIEAKFIELVKTNITQGFAYDYLIINQNKGIIDKTLLLNYKSHIRAIIINQLKPFKEELGYKKSTFEEWKEKTINEEYLNKLHSEIQASV